MPDTITAYYNFQPNTKARSSQVNANFSNYRGTLLPIDTDTAAAASLTYDLGTSEYFWKSFYGNDYYIGGSTGAWTASQNTTSSDLSLKYNSSEIAVVDSSGCPPLSPNRKNSYTTTAAIGETARTGLVNYFTNTSLSLINVAGSTLTISTTGRPVLIQMQAGNTAGGCGKIDFSACTGRVRLLRNGTKILEINGTNEEFGAGSLSFIDIQAAGTYNYSLAVAAGTPGGGISFSYLAAIEL